MRNLKKVLSLVLALVMTLSLATVAMAAPAPAPTAAPTTETSKTSLDFKDADDIENVDEVALLNSLSILAGYEDGSFGPEKTVTRAEAAKIVCYVLLGADVASGLGDATVETSFTDMDGAGWASGYVQYCATVGIINGYGDGRFGPQDTVTTYQLAKMLLVALGYGQNDEYTGSSWATNVAVDAMKAEILPKGTINEDCTRDMTALVAYNTLLAPTATYANGVYSTQTEKTVSTTISVGGDTLPYTYLSKVDNTSLAEQNFDLVKYNGVVTYTTLNGTKTFAIQKTDDAGTLTSTYVAFTGSIDMMNRNVTVWTLYNSKTKVYTLVTDVTVNGKTLSTTGNGTKIADLTDSTKKDYVASFNYASNVVDADFYVNGTAAEVVSSLTSGTATLTAAGYYVYSNEVYYSSTTTATPASDKCVAGLKGVGVEMYDSDNDGDVDAVFVTAKTVYTLAADVTVKQDQGKTTVTITTNEGTTIKSDEVVGYEGLKKGDVILAVKMGNGVTYIESAKSVEGTLTKIAQETKGPDTIYTYTFGGTAYNASGLTNATATALNSAGITGKTATIFLDSFGYIVASKDTVATTDTKFIYITKAFSAASTDKYSSTSTVTWVQGVLTDGTTAEYEIYDDGSDTTVTVDSKTYTVGVAAGNCIDYSSNAASYSTGVVLQYALKDGEIVLIVPDTAAATTEGTDTISTAISKSTTVSIGGNYFASDVNFIYVSGSGSTLKTSTLSGVQNVINGTSYTYTVAKDSNNRYVITAVYLSGVAGVASTDLIYLGSGAYAGSQGYTDANGKLKTGSLYNVYINGESKTLLTTSGSTLTTGKYYLYTVSNDVYTLTQIDGTTLTEANYGVQTNANITSIYSNYFSTAGHSDMIATDAVIVDLVNTKPDDVAITNMTALANTVKENTVNVSFVYDTNNKVSVVYINSITSSTKTLSIAGTPVVDGSTTIKGGLTATTAYSYALTIPEGASVSVSALSAPFSYNETTKAIEVANTSSATDNATATITVTAADSSTATYTLKMGVGSSAVTGTVAATTEIASVVISGTTMTVTSTSGQTVTGALLDTALEAAITGAAATSSNAAALNATGDTVTVVAQDGVTSATYNITYVATP